ncbi:TIGR03086 family protein [Saccharopolyspora antimicrobica]|uniref:TIGR03086 family protein n=1 Tax=Saccharopolyspora antimicrobica TaxID=455193 RepID=A0A1I5GP07_9PSEU|nr:TIGR03086 family metal-binding protein [Saccharopolyspora antimicrobica]RKT87430.1 uncharacterized protein (TIGR03086 family) [Saccharopolyspora antimicrobica]SFO37693.1 TIGR03086 family protein [Saccharopolyspora antimicrobica]
MDLLEMNRLAVRTSVRAVEALPDGALDRPTPCAGWSVGRLLQHMTAQHHGFAAAATGAGPDLAPWREAPLGADPKGDYAAAADAVLTAFAADGVLDREVWLSEITTSRTFRGRVAVSFHLLDYVLHGWDIAVSVGDGERFGGTVGAELVEASFEVARTYVPDGPARQRPGAGFGPSVPVPEQAPDFERLLGFLGRDPEWPAG